MADTSSHPLKPHLGTPSSETPGSLSTGGSQLPPTTAPDVGAWRAELIQVLSPGWVPLTAAPSHRTIPSWPEAQLLPSLKSVLLLPPIPQVEKLRGRLAKQLLPQLIRKQSGDLNRELTVMKPLPATYLSCKSRCVLAEADRPLGTQRHREPGLNKPCDPGNQREAVTLSHLYAPEDVGKEHSAESQGPWDRAGEQTTQGYLLLDD